MGGLILFRSPREPRTGENNNLNMAESGEFGQFTKNDNLGQENERASEREPEMLIELGDS